MRDLRSRYPDSAIITAQQQPDKSIKEWSNEPMVDPVKHDRHTVIGHVVIVDHISLIKTN